MAWVGLVLVKGLATRTLLTNHEHRLGGSWNSLNAVGSVTPGNGQEEPRHKANALVLQEPLPAPALQNKHARQTGLSKTGLY